MNALPELKEKTCGVCDFQANTAEEFCPRCRNRLNVKSTIKGLGAVLICIGLFLIGIIGTVSVFIASTMANTGKSSSTSRWTGTTGEAMLIFAILGAVMLFGIASVITGGYQLVTGRRNQKLVYLILALGGILFIGAKVIILFVGE